MSSDGYLLGIDFGTESCRAVIFDLAGRPMRFAATPYHTRSVSYTHLTLPTSDLV